MFQEWSLLLASLAYLGLLFVIAWYGDRNPARWREGMRESVVYALSFGIYCTSWTFYGSVGRAAAQGADFFLIYVGPIAVLTIGFPLMRKILRVARAENVTSIADFVAARYGKSRVVAAVATLIAVFGVLPYIALQLEAVSHTFDLLVAPDPARLSEFRNVPLWRDTALFVALTMAAFTILFGLRNVEARDRPHGLILAIAFESLVKLAAFLAAGAFVVWGVHGGIGALAERALAEPAIAARLDGSWPQPYWLTLTVLSALAFLCLPRQFHVAVVAQGGPTNLPVATWLFPVYLIAINLFVPAIAMAGTLAFPGSAMPDLFVLLLPIEEGQSLLSLLIFIGGLSAATSMVIVASLALSLMVSNELVLPVWMRGIAHPERQVDIARRLIAIRRAVVVVLLLLAYLYSTALAGRYPLASIGLISFAAVAQLGPALLLGLYWRGAHRNGALAGMAGGTLIWGYAVLLPTFDAGRTAGSVFDFLIPGDHFSAGVTASLAVNLILLVGVSLLSRERERDRRQAESFVGGASAERAAADDTARQPQDWPELQALTARFLGEMRAGQLFATAPPLRDARAAAAFTERVLSGVIGAASARVIVAANQSRLVPGLPARRVLEAASHAVLFSRNLLHMTLENVGQGIAVIDETNALAAWNRRFIDFLALPEGAAQIGSPLHRLIAAAGEGPLAIDLRSLLDPVRPEETSDLFERRRADGMVLELRRNRLPEGGFVLVATDVTERVNAAAALRESERRMRLYTDNVPALMAYVDGEQRYRFANRSYEQALGVDRATVDGLPIQQALGAERYRRLKPHIDGVLAGARQEFEIEFDLPNRRMLARGIYIPHRDADGRVLGFFTLYQDITDLRLAERALRDANDLLERRVEERTGALTRLNQELAFAKMAADAANASKTHFLAAASHDLLQPLNAARLFTATLAERLEAGKAGELVAQIDRSLTSVEDLLRALLEISRLDAGALRPEIRSFAAGELLDSLAQSFAPMAERRGLKLRVRPCRAVLRSDPTLIRRVLQNLLSNALLYTGRGGVLMGCRPRGGRMIIEVHDTGPGIPPDKMETIFEEFQRLNATEQAPGLGLGLAIVRRIARMLDLKLTVRSTAGRGSTFAIEVPLGNPAEAEVARAVDEPARQPADLLAGHRVLCIDNDRAVLQATRGLLEAWGCTVDTAASRGEIEQALRQGARPPDALLLDYHLGDSLNGLDLMQSLPPAWHEASFCVLVTADHGAAVRTAAQRLGLPLLHKPVRPAALRALLTQAFLSREAARRQAG